MRLIDADALDAQIYNDIPIEVFGSVARMANMRELVSKQPTVDAVPVVHGRWQWISSTYDRTPCEQRYMCSKCRHETITHGYEPWEKYCSNCGAKMDL